MCMARAAIIIEQDPGLTVRSLIRYIRGFWPLITALVCTSQASGQAPFLVNDTTFLLREDKDTGYHAVFIAAPSDTMWYERLAAPVGDMTRERWVRLQLEALDELGKRPVPILPQSQPIEKDWVAVKRIGGEHFLYAPSDWGYHRRMQVGEKAVVTSGMEGAEAHVIVGGDGWVDGTYRLRCVSLVSRSMDPGRDTVDVVGHPLPGNDHLTLWTFRDSYGESTYELMTPLRYAPGFRVVVNHSRDRKQAEFGFDEAGPNWLQR